MSQKQDMPEFVALGIYKGKELPFVRTYYEVDEMEADKELCERFFYTPFGEYNLLLDCLVHQTPINGVLLSGAMWGAAMSQMLEIMERYFPGKEIEGK